EPERGPEGEVQTETPPPTISASGRRRCRATDHLAHREGSNVCKWINRTRGHPAAQPVTRPTRSRSGADHDFFAIAKPGALRGPRATRRAAAQWRNRHFEFVASFEALAGPSLARPGAWRHPFEIPDGDAAILRLGLQKDKRVGARVLELPHDAFEFDLILVIEHRKGVVRHRRATHRDQSTADQYDRETLSHGASSYAGIKCFEHTATPLRTLGSAAHLCLWRPTFYNRRSVVRGRPFLRVGSSVLPCCQGPAQAMRSDFSARATAIPNPGLRTCVHFPVRLK